MNPITVAALEAAINRARSADEPNNRGVGLAEDLNELAGIYGKLIYRGHKNFDADSLEPAAKAALLRWLASAPDQNKAA